jgi:hypothetical protein
MVRTNDGNSAPAGSVIYFINDGTTRTCFFDNFNIDTGGFAFWTTATNNNPRMVLPTINATKPWSPFALNCNLPAGSKVNGYYDAN